MNIANAVQVSDENMLDDDIDLGLLKFTEGVSETSDDDAGEGSKGDEDLIDLNDENDNPAGKGSFLRLFSRKNSGKIGSQKKIKKEEDVDGENEENKRDEKSNAINLFDDKPEKQQKRRSFFLRSQKEKNEDDKLKNEKFTAGGDTEVELTADTDCVEESKDPPVGSIRGLFTRRKNGEEVKCTRDEDNSSEEEEEHDDDDDSSYDSEDDEDESKRKLEQSSFRTDLLEHTNKSSMNLNKNVKTFRSSKSTPENREQNRAMHIKRLTDGVSRYMPQVFQHEKEVKMKNKIVGFGNDASCARNEITYSMNGASETSQMEYYQSGTLDKTQTSGFHDDVFQDGNKSFIERWGDRVVTFFEQHPEIIEFIDGPEGEGNKGFYRHVHVKSNNIEDSDEEINFVEMKKWKKTAEMYKHRVQMLETELAETEKKWEEKLLEVQKLHDKLKAHVEEVNSKNNMKKKEVLADDLKDAKALEASTNADVDLICLSNDTPTQQEINMSSAPTENNDEGGNANIEDHAINSELSVNEVNRYSRQLLIGEGFGVVGQKKLLASKVLVVGAGGIGSTVLPYLAAAGVGSITIVDHDKVDSSNLHRQIIHSEKSVSINKAVSACNAIKALNSSISCTPIEEHFSPSNALELVKAHDVVVDATDNPKTRYLINDACALSGSIPLVSGSAMGTEGQLSVYNFGEQKTCYRCLYPKINPTEGCKSCSDNGVLGPVPGIIGILQAVEVIKILTGIGSIMHDRLIMYDSLRCSFLNLKKPPARRSSCPLCSDNASIRSMEDSLQSLEGARGPDNIPTNTDHVSLPLMVPDIDPKLNITCTDFDKLRKENTIPHILIDVRVKRQYEICAMESSINIPLGELESRMDEVKELSANWEKKVFCICRRGIASAEATRILNEFAKAEKGKEWRSVYNIRGGMNAWLNEVDPNIPMY